MSSVWYAMNPAGARIHRSSCRLARPEWRFAWLDNATPEYIRTYLGLMPQYRACPRCRPDQDR